jgi:hypothetical protein
MSALQDNPELLARLLTAIEMNRLVIFCGAGLSFGVVPTAGQLAAECSIRYDAKLLPVALPEDIRGDLERLTEFLFAANQKNLFIRELVDWKPFRGVPKKGHSAVADFLCCHIAEYVVTTNYDELIETAAKAIGEGDPEPSLDAESVAQYRLHKPLLKIHGTVIDKDHTLWCKTQLRNPRVLDGADRILRARVFSSLGWLRASLLEKDLVFVGFWTDWKYFNELFSNYLKSVHGQSIMLVDPQPSDALKAKAPKLWAWGERHGPNFFHLQESGDVFLDELRVRFSQNLLQRALAASMASIPTAPGEPTAATGFDGLTADEMYALRRDFSGIPIGEVPRFKRPAGMDAVGRAHLHLRRRNAQLEGSLYVLPDFGRIRVINGQTKLLNEVRSRFASEPPRIPPVDYVICAGAEDDGNAKTNIVRGGGAGDIIRPGSPAQWLSLPGAHAAGLC